MTRRWRFAAIGTAVVLALIAGGLLYVRGGSTPVPFDEVVERFREASPAPASSPARSQPEEAASAPVVSTPAPRSVRSAKTSKPPPARPTAPRALPPEGVYAYSTNGYDEVDVLGGSRHTYPDRTTISVRHDGCGLIERWDALNQRWDERESCRTPSGDRLKRTSGYHEFFRQGDTLTMMCDGYIVPVDARPGDSWTSRCASEKTVTTSTTTAIAVEDVTVDGKRVAALRLRVESKITGEHTGRRESNVWESSDSGLVLKEQTETRTKSEEAAYIEQYELSLESLRPRR